MPDIPAPTGPVPARALFPFPCVVFLCFLAVCLPLPVLSPFVHDGLGFSLVTAGLVVGLQALTTVVSRPWAGRLIDRHGPRRIALLGLPLVALSGGVHLAAALIPEPSLALGVLLLGRLLMGPAESLALVAAMAWAIGRLGPARTGLVMTWQGIALFAALGIGAPAGLWLAREHGFAGVALGAVVAAALAFLVALPLAPVQTGGARGGTSFLGVLRLIWRQGLVLTCSAAPQSLIGAFIALHYANKGWEGAGLTLTGLGAGVILVRAVLSHAPDRWGGRRVGLVSLVVEAVGQALLWTATDPVMAVAGAVLSGAGFSLIYPAMGVEAVRRVPAASRGLALGSFSAFYDAAIGLAGPAGGLIAGLAGYPAVFLFGTLTCVAGLALLAPRSAGPD